jgi:hypothetical protein
MDSLEIAKSLANAGVTEALLTAGILVDVSMRDGRVITGYLDKIGMNQYEDKIIIANSLDQQFQGKNLVKADILNISPSSAGKSSF